MCTDIHIQRVTYVHRKDLIYIYIYGGREGREREGGREGERGQPSMVINTATKSTISRLNCVGSNLFFWLIGLKLDFNLEVTHCIDIKNNVRLCKYFFKRIHGIISQSKT